MQLQMRTSVATILLLSSILAHSSCFILPRIVVLRNKQRLVSTTATMAKSKGPKVYAVAKGRKPGIYNTWGECQAQVSLFSFVCMQCLQKIAYHYQYFITIDIRIQWCNIQIIQNSIRSSGVYTSKFIKLIKLPIIVHFISCCCFKGCILYNRCLQPRQEKIS